MRRSYAQYCTLARALDIVGERWTLLVIRELLVRPKRFGELLDGLPGISRNLLAARLRQLRDDGLVDQENGAYMLTSDGESLAPALTELSRWGAGRLGPLRSRDAFQSQWVMGTLTATANTAAARGVHETYEYDIEGDTFHIRVDNGAVSAHLGAADRPDLRIHATPQTLAAIAAGELTVNNALGTHAVRVEGRPEALAHAIEIIGSAWGTN